MAPMSEPRAQIAIVDYGMGNLRSAAKALEHVGAAVIVTSRRSELLEADALVLPGVGAFPEAMRRIEERSLAAPIRERVGSGAPLLGICLGMQLLFEFSDEHGGAAGLGLLPGRVEAMDVSGAGDLKLPHIGWSNVEPRLQGPLTAGLAPEGDPFYFVHSFVARPEPAHLLATSAHGREFAAIVGDGNVFGTQFHPEKSSAAGLRMLSAFVAAVTPAGVA